MAEENMTSNIESAAELPPLLTEESDGTETPIPLDPDLVPSIPEETPVVPTGISIPAYRSGILTQNFENGAEGWTDPTTGGHPNVIALGSSGGRMKLSDNAAAENTFNLTDDNDLFLEIDIRESGEVQGGLNIEINGKAYEIFEFNKVTNSRVEDTAGASGTLTVDGQPVHWRKLESADEPGTADNAQAHTIELYIPREAVEGDTLDLKLKAGAGATLEVDKLKLSHTTVDDAKDDTFFVNNDTATEIATGFAKMKPADELEGKTLGDAADSIRDFTVNKLAEGIVDLSSNLGVRNLAELELGSHGADGAASDTLDKTTLIGVTESAINVFDDWKTTFNGWTEETWQRLDNEDKIDDAKEQRDKINKALAITGAVLTTVGSGFSFAFATQALIKATAAGGTDAFNLGQVAASLWFTGNAINTGRGAFDKLKPNPGLEPGESADVSKLKGEAGLLTSIGNLTAELERRGELDLAKKLAMSFEDGLSAFVGTNKALAVGNALQYSEHDPKANKLVTMGGISDFDFDVVTETTEGTGRNPTTIETTYLRPTDEDVGVGLEQIEIDIKQFYKFGGEGGISHRGKTEDGFAVSDFDVELA